eukprot:5889716-Prymnesium_polylepis.1
MSHLRPPRPHSSLAPSGDAPSGPLPAKRTRCLAQAARRHGERAAARARKRRRVETWQQLATWR